MRIMCAGALALLLAGCAVSVPDVPIMPAASAMPSQDPPMVALTPTPTPIGSVETVPVVATSVTPWPVATATPTPAPPSTVPGPAGIADCATFPARVARSKQGAYAGVELPEAWVGDVDEEEISLEIDYLENLKPAVAACARKQFAGAWGVRAGLRSSERRPTPTPTRAPMVSVTKSCDELWNESGAAAAFTRSFDQKIAELEAEIAAGTGNRAILQSQLVQFQMARTTGLGQARNDFMMRCLTPGGSSGGSSGVPSLSDADCDQLWQLYLGRELGKISTFQASEQKRIREDWAARGLGQAGGQDTASLNNLAIWVASETARIRSQEGAFKSASCR